MANTDNPTGKPIVEPLVERPFMPGYGIETGSTGLLPWSWAVQRLDRARHFSVATRDADGAPHLSVVWAIWVDPNLYFSCGHESRKARNLAQDARCAVSVADGPDAVVVEGSASIVTDRDEVTRVLEAYVAKYGEGFPPDSPPFAVRPTRAFGTIDAGNQFTTTATRWRFPQP